MDIIGQIVVSGNVRRSAQIALGDCKDKEFLRAKRWDLGNIPNWRCYSNNSVVCNDINDILDNEDFWAGYQGNGEPYGLINLGLSRKTGRLGEEQYPDPDVCGYNNPSIDTNRLGDKFNRPLKNIPLHITTIYYGIYYNQEIEKIWVQPI